MKLLYGNCLFGFIKLWWYFGGKPIILWKNRFPHFMLKHNNYYLHFKVFQDCFDPPFCYFIFKGQYVKQNAIYSNSYEIITYEKN